MSQERHLSEAQISAYLSAKPDVSSETDSGTESHLEECESCRSRTLEMHREQMDFRKAGRMNRDCPEDEILQQVAAGGSEPAIAARTMDHAARCSHCGPRLKKLANIFSGELSPQQQKIIAQLQTSKREWQREFIRDYVKPREAPGSDKPGWWAQIFGTWWGRAGMAAAAAAVVVAAVFEVPVLLAKYDLYHAQKLVASAYGERRTIEPRFSGVPSADYKPYPVVLGPDDEHAMDVNRPALMKAEGNVAENVKGQDARWLQLQGRISLLESTPKSIAQAQKYFEEAQRKGLNTPSLKIDLASSYYEHDVRAEYPNLQRTLDLLLEVLHQPNLSKEDHAAALFDLAIAYEKTQAWDLAASTWEDYLKVDSSGAWADEARKRLKAAKEKIPAPKPQGYNQPIFFLQHLSQLKPEDPEEYQAIALSQWLPDALEHGNTQAREAVNKLADVLAIQHSDPWLKDFSTVLKPQDLPALQLLNEAVQANANGGYNSASKKSVDAEKSFAQQRNSAGELRAKLEEVYAQRRFLQGIDCLKRANPLLETLSATKYYWLRAKASLERAECDNLRGEFIESDKNLKASRELAEEFDFPELVLQDVGIGAGNKRLRGKYDESWQDSVEALGLYWRGAYPRGERLFQFYAVMLQCALDTGSLYVGEAWIRRTILLRNDSRNEIRPNATSDGLLHIHLSNILRAWKKDVSARQERHVADVLLDKPGARDPQKYKLIAELELAQLQLKQRDPPAALATLDSISQLLHNNQEQFFSLNFYQLQGSAFFQSSQFDSSAHAFEAAINTAESSLQNLKNAVERARWLRATDASYKGLVRTLLAQNKSQEALERWEWYKSRPWSQDQTNGSFHGLSSDVSSIWKGQALTKVRQSNASQARIVYALFEDGLEIWVLKGSDVQARWMPIRERDFDQMVQDFVDSCATPDSKLEEIYQQSEGLYALLIGPVISDLQQATIITVEPDRLAYPLPLEALRDPRGWYFGERYSIVYSPGLILEKDLRAPISVGSQEKLLLLDASHSFQGEYLPGLDSERRMISKLFARSTTVDTARVAWPEFRPLVNTADVLIYMGHGKKEGDGTALVLNERQSLTAADFRPAILQHMKLSVLSACSTARGEGAGLLDTQNLVHSFLAAGVPNVVASRWNVDAQNTALLLNIFYSQLKENKPVAEAMHSARVAMLHNQPHPYYWAGFNVSGRAE